MFHVLLRPCEISTFCIQSGEIAQHVGAMMAALLRRIRQWPALERLLARLAGHFTTWPADEFTRFTRTPIASAGPGEDGAAPPRTALTQPHREPAMAPG